MSLESERREQFNPPGCGYGEADHSWLPLQGGRETVEAEVDGEPVGILLSIYPLTGLGIVPVAFATLSGHILSKVTVPGKRVPDPVALHTGGVGFVGS